MSNEERKPIDTGDLDLKELIQAFVRRWYWFVLFAIVGLAVGKYIADKQTLLHDVQSIVLIEDNSDRAIVKESPVPGLSLMNRTKRLENEIEIFSSKDLMEKAVQKTQAFISCFEGHTTNKEVFVQDIPFLIDVPNPVRQIEEAPAIYFTHLDEDNFEINYTLNNNEVISQHRYNEEFLLNGSAISIQNNLVDSADALKQYTFYVNGFNNKVRDFRSNLEVMESNKNTDGILLSIATTLPEQALALQNALVETYFIDVRNQHKEMAENAYQFIEGRLEINFDNLDSLEAIMEEYRRSRDMVMPDKQVEFLYEGIKEFKTELSDAQTQLDIVDKLLTSIDSDGTELSVPNTVLGVTDPLLNDLLLRLTSKENEREKMKETVHPNNPLFKQLTNQIKELQISMKKDLKIFRSNMQISVQDIEKRIENYELEILSLSGNNRELDGFERKRMIMEELYNYLLKRREEAAMVASAEFIDTWVIEKPHVNRIYNEPKKSMILLFGALLGLLIPASFFGYQVLFNKRIASIEELKKNSSIPVIHSIGRSKKTNNGHQKYHQEDFKALYFNLKFTDPNVKKVLFTSAIENEGKTHCAINFAMTLATLGKKTCLVELDLRRPCFIDRLEISENRGVLNILDGSATLPEVTKRSAYSEDLKLIPAGTTDHDPLRLLMSDQFKRFLQELERTYDHIIFDAPPSMIASDILVLSRHADLNIFVVRQDLTPRAELARLEESYQQNRIQNMVFLFNGDSTKRNTENYYGYAG